MKASRQLKLETQLAAAESELRQLLVEALPLTATSGNLLFFNSAFCPSDIQSHWLAKENEDLLSLAQQSLALREDLGLSVIGTTGQLFLSACSEAANTSNSNRRGPRQLATWLMSELGA